ncbi:hypothetical protein HD554DRAFT_2034948 [Boletus coccyginus]|nr:hypothetical protein HD554DRAFT_2034948 [Boletus coccyginus]
MPVTPSLLAFIFIGIAAAGVLPEIAVRDGTVAGQGGLTLGFSDPPRQTNPPLPSGLIVDATDVLKRTGKHPGFPSGVSDHLTSTGDPSRPRPSRKAYVPNSAAVRSTDRLTHEASPTGTNTDSYHHHHDSPSDCSAHP